MYSINCAACGAVYIDQWWLCPKCSGSLVVRYDRPAKIPQYPLDDELDRDLGSGLGEGQTPLIALPRISRMIGAELWAKCEFVNPTGSFKDRGSIVEIVKTQELGKRGVVCASTGNMAASLAAYAARAGITCVVVVPAATPASKLRQATACGARLVSVAGTYDDCVERAQQVAEQDNLFLCGDYVLRREGQKTIGWELAGKGFDGFVVPVGNGTVGIAIVQGLAEAGDDSVSFIGAQPASVNPIEKAWKSSRQIAPLSNTKTIASACNVGNPLDGNLTLQRVRKTSGFMLCVTEDQIVQAQELLALKEGLFVESAAAVGLAAVIKDRDSFKGRKLVLILTGSGLKECAVQASKKERTVA